MEQGLFQTEVAELIDRYGYLVLRRCERLLIDETLAQRAFRETFRAAAETGADLRSMSHKLGWLYAAAEDACAALADARTQQADEPLIALWPDLDPVDRRIAMLALLGDMRLKEIIEHTGWPVKRIDKALDNLKTRTGQAPSDSLVSRFRIEAWHAGDPDADVRRHVESSPEARALIAELDAAKETFSARFDAQAEAQPLFPDAPTPTFRGRAKQGLAVMVAVVLAAFGALALWPRDPPPVIPDAFQLAVILERDGAETRALGPRLELRGRDALRVELSVPEDQILNVLILEKNGSLTAMAEGRLFRAGVHVLPQTIHVNEKKPIVARLIAGPPADVRTATASNDMRAVHVIELESVR